MKFQIFLTSLWLGEIYEWAGNYRQVNISKAGFPFAVALQIPRLMEDFEDGVLKAFTPCRSGSIKDISEALAVVHAELILIHPFREGNGRIARLFSNLMALQADLPALSFDAIARRKRGLYIEAIHQALDRNYQPMTNIFISILKTTLKEVERL